MGEVRVRVNASSLPVASLVQQAVVGRVVLVEVPRLVTLTQRACAHRAQPMSELG